MKIRYRYSEAAEQLGISRAKLHRRVREGRLIPVRDGAQPFFTHAELTRYAASTQPILEKYRPAEVRRGP